MTTNSEILKGDVRHSIAHATVRAIINAKVASWERKKGQIFDVFTFLTSALAGSSALAFYQNSVVFQKLIPEYFGLTPIDDATAKLLITVISSLPALTIALKRALDFAGSAQVANALAAEYKNFEVAFENYLQIIGEKSQVADEVNDMFLLDRGSMSNTIQRDHTNKGSQIYISELKKEQERLGIGPRDYAL